MESNTGASASNKKKRRAEVLDGRQEKMSRPNRTPPTTRRMSISGSAAAAGATEGDKMMTQSMLEKLLNGLETRLGGKIDKMETNVKKNADEIKEVRQTLEKTESNLLDRMDVQRRELEAKIARTNAVAAAAVQSSGGKLTPRNEETYWLHRRSLRMRPIIGDEITVGLKNFLIKKLKFSESGIKELGPISVRRLKDPRSKERKEAVCTFENNEARDAVKRAGFHLAKEGKDVGMSIHVPGFLLDNYYLLQSIAWSIKESDPQHPPRG